MKTKTRHDVKKFVMTWKTYHDIQNVVIISKTRFHYIVFLKLKKIINTTKSWSWIQKYVIPTKRKNTPWRHKVRHYVKKCVKTSKSVSCCQKVPWRQNVCHDMNKCNIRHSAKTFVTSKMFHVINTSWCDKVRHDVNTRHHDQKFVIT